MTGASASEVHEPQELAYYYPEPYWLSSEGSWIKSLLLFFDGVAILLPDYMRGREVQADPTLAGPLADLGLLRVLEPEWFVDEALAEHLAQCMVELIAGEAFAGSDGSGFAELSMSRMGYAELSRSRMGSHHHRGVFEMIYDDLRSRGLALESEDGLSIPLRTDVRTAYLLLLAQEAREAGLRHGLDLHPTTNSPEAMTSLNNLLTLPAMPLTREQVVDFDLATVTVDLDSVPLDEVLDFRSQHRGEHEAYMLDLRRFTAEVSTAEPADRVRLFNQRQAELTERAENLRKRTFAAFKSPSTLTGFAIGVGGGAWTIGTGDPIGGALVALGALVGLLPGKKTGSAYSYLFRAHGQF